MTAEATAIRGLPRTADPLSKRTSSRSGPYRWFGLLLSIGLFGYLFFDKAFAYLHVPGTPLFIGEILLLVGLWESLPHAFKAHASPQRARISLALLAFIALGAARLIATDLTAYGIPAVRDSAIWYYALFSYLVAIAVLRRPGFGDELLRRYRKVLPWFLAWAPLSVISNRVLGAVAPMVPDSPVSIVTSKPGNVAVMIGIAIAYVWLCDPVPTSSHDRRTRIWLTLVGLAGLLVAGSQNRGGMLSAVCILGAVWLITPMRSRLFFAVTYIVLGLLVTALVLDVRVQLGIRELSAAQLIENIASVTGGDVANEQLEGTVEWRQELWSAAIRDVVRSNQALIGFGFGQNLAARYGFSRDTGDDPSLRSPHNSHLSVLSRMGIAGIILWTLFWMRWTITTLKRARRIRTADHAAAARMTWCVVSAIGILLNGFFDPTLESPQVAIWLWTLIGLGSALGLAHRPQVHDPLHHRTPLLRHLTASGAETRQGR